MSAPPILGGRNHDRAHHILITGCSGGGKSSLLDALARRGHSTVREPGLRIVQSERARGGMALPWIDMHAFLWRTMEMAKADLARTASKSGLVFYDRGVLDAAVGLKDLCDLPFSETLGNEFPYSKRVILVPPWREIYAVTEDRQHSFEEATSEYDRIRSAAVELGCEILELPRVDMKARLKIVESTFGL